MGAGNTMGGGGVGNNPKLNAKNRGAFAVGGMGRPGNGGGAGTIPGLGINRDRWQGMNAQQRQGWRDMRQAGGGGAGAFANYQAAQNMRDRGQQLTQGALAAQNNAVPPAANGQFLDSTGGPTDGKTYERIQAANPGSISAAAQHALSGLGYQLGIAGPPSDPMSGTAPPQATTAPPADQAAAAPPETSPPAQGAFTKQPREPRVGLGGMDANWWKQVGYSPYAVSQLPGMLSNAGGLNRGYSPVTDWNNPNQIRRAIQSLPMDMSRYANNGRAMGMKYDPKVWGNWTPGRFQGVGPAMDFPNPDLVNGGG